MKKIEKEKDTLLMDRDKKLDDNFDSKRRKVSPKQQELHTHFGALPPEMNIIVLNEFAVLYAKTQTW